MDAFALDVLNVMFNDDNFAVLVESAANVIVARADTRD